MTYMYSSSYHPLCATGAKAARSVSVPWSRGNPLGEPTEWGQESEGSSGAGHRASSIDGNEEDAGEDEEHAKQASFRQPFAKE